MLKLNNEIIKLPDTQLQIHTQTSTPLNVPAVIVFVLRFQLPAFLVRCTRTREKNPTEVEFHPFTQKGSTVKQSNIALIQKGKCIIKEGGNFIL